MYKRFSITVLLIVVLLAVFATNAFSTPAGGSYSLGIEPIPPIQLAVPFHIKVFGEVADTASVSLEIILSEGLQLLKGDLRALGILQNGCSSSRSELAVQLNKPGIYEVSATLYANRPNATKLQDSLYKKYFPYHKSIFFYVREDTVAWFKTRQELERQIRDSMIVSKEVLDQRRLSKRDSLFWYYRTKENLPPIATSENLVHVVYIYNLFSDSIKASKLSIYYSTDQIDLIKKYHLMYSPPQFDKLENMLKKDFRSSVSTFQLDSLAQIMKYQIKELYEFDKRVLRTPNSEALDKLLDERATMLSKQTEERKAIVADTTLEKKR